MERTTCRSCGSDNLTEVLDLGEQYVSDFVQPGHEKDGLLVPIVLDLCRSCTLVQARHTPPPEMLYKRQYWYRSGVTDTMRAALRDVVDSATKRVDLEPGDVALDVGSNDGTLLRCYDAGVATVGFEPADNLQEEGSRGVTHLVHDFWNAEAYLNLGLPKAKIVTACGMFYDLDDPNPFVAGVARVLADDGVFVAQLMCLQNTVELGDVGNFSHEHLEFYTLRSLGLLFARHGLAIVDLEKNVVNGGSYRIYVKHAAKLRGISPALADAIDAEPHLSDPWFYRQWQGDIAVNSWKLSREVSRAVQDGKRVWVYGASTKGNVILQHAGLDHSLIGGAAERSPEKWGLVTIGSGIPIYSEQHAREQNPDYFLALPYAFVDEFVRREREWLESGGTFMVPLPKFHLVGAPSHA